MLCQKVCQYGTCDKRHRHLCSNRYLDRSLVGLQPKSCLSTETAGKEPIRAILHGLCPPAFAVSLQTHCACHHGFSLICDLINEFQGLDRQLYQSFGIHMFATLLATDILTWQTRQGPAVTFVHQGDIATENVQMWMHMHLQTGIPACYVKFQDTGA
jgi:hypothetical protein